MNNLEITEGTIDEVRVLLEKSHLPVMDLDDEKGLILIARAGEEVIGCVGIERYGVQSLLRSLAVDAPRRNTGIGSELVEAALSLVKADGATEVFAVTTTAEDYLERFGFERIDRESVDGEIQQASQLRGVCPADSAVLVKSLKPVVVFMCVHNAGRSQMAAALLRGIAADRIDVRSAGSEPADQLNPVAVAAMAEVGMDISTEQPKLMTFDLAKEADIVITMGCGDACPVFPGKKYLDWELEDPAGKPIDEVRRIRDEIAERVEKLVKQLEIAS